MAEQKVIVDVDKAIESYNKRNPETPIDRYVLAEKLGKSYQDMVNCKAGRVPNFVKVLKKMIDETGADFNEVVTYKKQ